MDRTIQACLDYIYDQSCDDVVVFIIIIDRYLQFFLPAIIIKKLIY